MVPEGASLRIYIRMTRSGIIRSEFEIAISIVHELVHALGNPAFTARLDAPNSTWDEELTRDLLRGHDFETSTPQGGGATNIIGDSQTPGTLTGSSHSQVFVGSDSGNTFQPIGGGHVLYPGTGQNRYILSQNADLSIIDDRGGSHTFVLGGSVALTDVAIALAPTNDRITLLVRNDPLVAIDSARPLGPHYSIELATGIHAFSTLVSRTGAQLPGASTHIDFFGEFVGGVIGSAATTDPHNTNIFYRLGSVEGAYFSENWSVDPSSGAISGHFSKPDLGGSEFSFVTVLAGNGTDTAKIQVTIRWAYSGEMNPEF